MWTFISAQAELQLKALKERKKAEKVVFDTEERAFWRTRRPGYFYTNFIGMRFPWNLQ